MAFQELVKLHVGLLPPAAQSYEYYGDIRFDQDFVVFAGSVHDPTRLFQDRPPETDYGPSRLGIWLEE